MGFGLGFGFGFGFGLGLGYWVGVRVRVRREEGVLLDLAVAVEDLAELLHLLEAWRGVG